MKCPKCKKDFKAGVKAAYKLGIQDGKNQYNLHLNNIERTFHNLFDQLRVMDMREPDMANRVYFSRKFIDRLKKALRKANLMYWYKIVLEESKKQLGATKSAEAKLRELLEELKEE